MPTAAKKKSPATAKPAGSGHPDSAEEVMRSLIQRHLVSTLARHAGSATPRDWWVATALAVRDTIHERMIATQTVHNEQNVRRSYYFSLEYLIGRLFGSHTRENVKDDLLILIQPEVLDTLETQASTISEVQLPR